MCLVHPLSKAIRFLDYLDYFLCLDKQGSTTKKLLGTWLFMKLFACLFSSKQLLHFCFAQFGLCCPWPLLASMHWQKTIFYVLHYEIWPPGWGVGILTCRTVDDVVIVIKKLSSASATAVSTASGFRVGRAAGSLTRILKAHHEWSTTGAGWENKHADIAW